MSFNRSSKEARQDAIESNLEQQNDSHISTLHSKLSSLRGVTQDIYNDANSQNNLLNSTGATFDSFGNGLDSVKDRLATTISSSSSNKRLGIIVLSIIGCAFIYKAFFGTRA